MTIVLSKSPLSLVRLQYKRFVRTVKDTGRYVPSGAEVAFDNSFAIQVATKRPIRTGYYARPATTALFHINDNLVTCRLFVHRTCKAGINTPGLGAVATLNWKRNLHVPLHTETGQSTRSLFFECFNGVLGFGVLYLAVDSTESAANADLFVNIDCCHVLALSQFCTIRR
jgi:hypothetical protein